ncbi:type II toxin-antitoxin system VapC family toxin [Candidatus Gottesmanbacteria bacterium]|nr:type II toxin-antitoxin system VapC family toxin [Candidatus Gottesmanbacteria bacterium]
MRITLNGKWVFDSNLFIYFLDKSSPFYEQARALFAEIISEKIQPYCGQQNIIEVERILVQRYKITVPEITPKVDTLITEFHFRVMAPFPYTVKTFHTILPSIKSGGDIFDYYLAATMLDNGINRILTVNTKDFSQIKEIQAINPFK